MIRLAPAFSAALLGIGCGTGPVRLRYAPVGPTSASLPPVKVALRVDAGRARNFYQGFSSDAELKFEEPPGESLRRAMEAELARLGLSLSRDPSEAAAIVEADLIEVACYYWSANTEVAFRLGIKDARGRLLGERVLRGGHSSSPFFDLRPRCGRDGGPALARAMEQVGPILEAEGWLARAAGAREANEASGVPFPLGAGNQKPVVLILPVEDLVGTVKFKLPMGSGRAAHGAEQFDQAIRQEISLLGLGLASTRARADWVLKPSFTGAWGRQRQLPPPRTVVKLRFFLRVEDRSGELLWEGPLDGEAQAAAAPHAIRDVTKDAVREAARKLPKALRAEDVQPSFTQEELKEARAGGSSGVGTASSVLGFLQAFAPGLSSLKSLTDQGSSVFKKVETGLKVAQAVQQVAEQRAQAALPPVKAPGAAAQLEIALLPFNNQTVSLDGPVLVRALIEGELLRAGFRVKGLERTDEALKAIGITDGGQLPSKSPQELARALQVDGLLYGELEAFDSKNVGVYSNRTVGVKLWLVKGEDGSKVWQAEKKKSNPKAALTASGVKDALVEGYGRKLAETAMKSPLKPEAEVVADQIVRDLAAGFRW